MYRADLQKEKVAMKPKGQTGANATPNSLLASMAVLLGAWTMESPQFPEFRGRATFEWIEDGAYLAVRDDVEKGDFPSSTWIIGGDDSRQVCTSLYHDSRGVRRVYETTIVDDIWQIWRNAPEFNQRFIGKIVDAGTTIAAQWEMSQDGSNWAKDFDVVYRKLS